MKNNHLSDATKILIFAAATIITCVIVALGFRALNIATSISDNSISKLTSLDEELQNSDILQYDEAIVYGSDVVNCIKKQLGDYDSPDVAPIYVSVKTSLAENTYTNGNFTSNIRSFTDAKYIKPTTLFLGCVIKNTNGVIVGIGFVQQ